MQGARSKSCATLTGVYRRAEQPCGHLRESTCRIGGERGLPAIAVGGISEAPGSSPSCCHCQGSSQPEAERKFTSYSTLRSEDTQRWIDGGACARCARLSNKCLDGSTHQLCLCVVTGGQPLQPFDGNTAWCQKHGICLYTYVDIQQSEQGRKCEKVKTMRPRVP